MNLIYKNFSIRPWKRSDRSAVADVVATVLTEYGLEWEPTGADRDAIEVERYYQQTGGEFWAIERNGTIVGSAGYYPIARGKNAVEIRKMYLLPEVRRQGLGKFLLQELEKAIAARHFDEIWIETASALAEAIQLYEKSGYQPATGVETARCDRVYVKKLNRPQNGAIEIAATQAKLAGAD